MGSWISELGSSALYRRIYHAGSHDLNASLRSSDGVEPSGQGCYVCILGVEVEATGVYINQPIKIISRILENRRSLYSIITYNLDRLRWDL